MANNYYIMTEEYTNYTDYTNFIESFIQNDVNSWNFKSNPIYCNILEHVDKEYGDRYLFEIKTKFQPFYNNYKNYFTEICHINDLYGKTRRYEFDDFTYCSPSNLRYIMHSLLVLTYMTECKLNNIDIIEIGGGYGGLCFFMHKLSPIFNININSYSIFDLTSAMRLQKKYLEKLNINGINYIELSEVKNLNKNSFLISNYAFSEISLDLQKEYTDKVLNPYVSHGFLCWNVELFYKFIENKHIEKELEYPFVRSYCNYVRFKPLN